VTPFADTSGQILVNGDPVESLKPYKKEMAFVPQDDIMYEELTVEDNLMFTAILFNRRGYSTPFEVCAMVEHAEMMLGIEFIRNSIVGSPEKKGIEMRMLC
jgi:ABC-type sugar transport system ATPase subunit